MMLKILFEMIYAILSNCNYQSGFRIVRSLNVNVFSFVLGVFVVLAI